MRSERGGARRRSDDATRSQLVSVKRILKNNNITLIYISQHTSTTSSCWPLFRLLSPFHPLHSNQAQTLTTTPGYKGPNQSSHLVTSHILTSSHPHIRTQLRPTTNHQPSTYTLFFSIEVTRSHSFFSLAPSLALFAHTLLVQVQGARCRCPFLQQTFNIFPTTFPPSWPPPPAPPH